MSQAVACSASSRFSRAPLRLSWGSRSARNSRRWTRPGEGRAVSLRRNASLRAAAARLMAQHGVRAVADRGLASSPVEYRNPSTSASRRSSGALASLGWASAVSTRSSSSVLAATIASASATSLAIGRMATLRTVRIAWERSFSRGGRACSIRVRKALRSAAHSAPISAGPSVIARLSADRKDCNSKKDV